ncbi:MAG: hypothetical protein M1484_03480 [Patescibacteria group bacterium]|nr:hypothetical protein [Patescibacteria group bacterium]MCL5432124.1 hypothetical protein [Patescibacteria group bacterium]
MAGYGDFYNKNKKKLSKEELARKAARVPSSSWSAPAPQVIKKGKKDEKTSW